jgi:Ca2+-binding RTX toxin-like protein
MRGARLGLSVLICAAIGLAASNALATTEVGNKLGNLLVGTRGADTLIGKGGVDLLKGKAGADRLIGGKGRDGLIGGLGRDRLIGGPGNDVIKATDGRADRRIDGGPGTNTCVVDIPADLSVTIHCGTLRAGTPPGGGRGGGGGGAPGTGLTVTSAQGLTCLPQLGCLFTITGKGADAVTGTVTAGGAVTSVANVAVTPFPDGRWLATGIYNCSTAGGPGWLVVTIGTKSTPQIPVAC